jgi:glycosyltransferase involved in cell wall biosynthesis
VVGWDRFQARTAALARSLEGGVLFTRAGAPVRSRWLLPLRYLADTARTWGKLSRERPAVVVVTTPPVFAPIVAWGWCALNSARLVVDCHTGAFTDRRWAWSRPIHRVLLRRVAVALVHTDSDRELLAGWHVPVLLLPDDVPGETEAGEPVARGSRPRVLVAGSFDETEPFAGALAAAELVPELEVRFTGDPLRLPGALRRPAAGNIVLTGFLDYPRFLAEMLAADVVAVFSEETNTMSRAAFEAAGLGQPMVLSDQPGLRERFGSAALFTANRPEAMAASLREAVSRSAELAARSRALKAALVSQREDALQELGSRLAAAASARPERVLVVSGYPFPDHVILRNVRSLLAAGAEVDVLCPWISNLVGLGKEGLPGLRVYRLPVHHRRSHPLWYVFEYCSILLLALPLVSVLGALRRYRSVDVYNQPDLAVFTALVPKLRGARVVLNMLEMNPELTATRLRLRAGHPLVRLAVLCEQAAVRWADGVITVSDTWRRILVGRGADPERVAVVPNTQYPPEQKAAHTTAGSPVLVAHGVQIERYGLQLVMRALPRLLERWPDLRFELIGDGEYQSQLRRLASELGVAGQVDFQGFIPEWQQAIDRVSRATIGLVPILDDGYGSLILPTRLIDYAALGIPAVCSRLAAMEEYFPPGCVSYFTPGDVDELAERIEELLDQPERGRRQAERAAGALKAISWESISDGYVDALGLGGIRGLPAVA